MTDILNDSYESDLTNEEQERLILISEHAVAPPLSPAARSIFESFNSKFEWVEDGVPGPQFKAIAAAIRAAVDYTKVHHGHDVWECDADELLAIADEFDGQ